MGRGWKKLGLFIIRRRAEILVVVLLITAILSFFLKSDIAYDFFTIVPKSDEALIEYKNFRKEFGEDANTMVVCLEGDIFREETLNGIYELTQNLKKVKGISEVVCLTSLYGIVADHDEEKFKIEKLFHYPIKSEAEAKELKTKFKELPFYSNLLLNESMDAAILALTIDSLTLDGKEKIQMVIDVRSIIEPVVEKMSLRAHYSGLPYIRAFTIMNLPKEMFLFLFMAVAVMVITMFIFFRSFWAVAIPLLTIAIVVIWTLGIMNLLGFKITMMTCLMPALITVIGIPNAIFLITKFHYEFRKTKNKLQALLRVIQKIGIVTVITNLNTAAGFLVLGFCNIIPMREFGIVAGISVIITFFISLILIPVIFSYLPAPSERITRHMDRRLINWLIEFTNRTVQNKRKLIYFISFGITAVSILGVFYVRPDAYLVDDLPRKNKIQTDLHYLEDNFKGVMPFEILVNTHKRQGIFDYKKRIPHKIDSVQIFLKSFSDISRSLSMVDFIKSGRQAYFGGKLKEYLIPDKEEVREIRKYLKRSGADSLMNGNALSDSTNSIARIKANIKDVGSIKLKKIIAKLDTFLEVKFVENIPSGEIEENKKYKIFGKERYQIEYAGDNYENGDYFIGNKEKEYKVISGSGKVDFADRIRVTGTTKIFTRGNDYLISNLLQNMILALIVIALMMVPLFGTGKMMIISLIPNIIPLVITTGIMGFFGIPLKPSTALIYSMSFGIAIDNSIHFLARYRYARRTGHSVTAAVTDSFQDTGMGMIYTSLILLVGFIMFAFSTFGSTRALGQLTTITLLIALFANLFLLPALIISLSRDTEKEEDAPMDYEEEDEDIESFKEIFSETENTDETQAKDNSPKIS